MSLGAGALVADRAPGEILLEGLDLDGNEIAVEAEEYLARVYQHEVDHLDGVLLIERLDPDQRKQAMRTLRQMTFDPLLGVPTKGNGDSGSRRVGALKTEMGYRGL